MSIRITLLFILVIGLAVYAYRDWFKSLCGLILLMAVIQHPDMPKSILGIQGLNPWNVLMFNVVVAWLISRRREGLVWDMPRYVNIMLLIYLGVVLVGFVRMMGDRSHMEELSIGFLASEFLINSVKWVVPGLLLFDGCRSQSRLVIALRCTLMLYVLLAVQVIKWVPLRFALSGASLTSRSHSIIDNEIGYSRVNMAMLLAGAAWAIVATLPLVRRYWHRLIVVGAALVTCLGLALTAGRMGYVTWAVLALTLCLLRWRRAMLILPLVLIIAAFALPGTVERMLTGFGETGVTGDTVTNTAQVTAGRTIAWPRVIDKIGESPIVGHGRQAMIRTGLTKHLKEEYNEEFGHPHNAYLEALLDNGIVGFLVMIPFYGVIVIHSVRLFLDRTSRWNAAVGGFSLALVLALMVAAMGSQTFYPREGAVGMWCAIGLMFRMSIERTRARVAVPPSRVRTVPTAARVCPADAGSSLINRVQWPT